MSVDFASVASGVVRHFAGENTATLRRYSETQDKTSGTTSRVLEETVTSPAVFVGYREDEITDDIRRGDKRVYLPSDAFSSGQPDDGEWTIEDAAGIEYHVVGPILANRPAGDVTHFVLHVRSGGAG